MEFSLILVAAGRGHRAGGDLPKQYQPLCGLPVITRTIHALLQNTRLAEIIPVIHPDDTELYRNATANITDPRLTPPVMGGKTRTESVYHGLQTATADYVLIHDAARPFVPPDMLNRLLNSLKQTDAAFVGLPITDALWQINPPTPINRDNMWRAQTPQGFKRTAITKAYTTLGLNFDDIHAMPDDDVGLMARVGVTPTPVLGDSVNIKITQASDLQKAETMMKSDIRVGSGFDVHSFGAGNHVILCGVKIPHTASLIGHSDADVGLHAITDAVLGALGQGDIGRWFPPTDPQWKGTDSAHFLRHAMGLCAEAGFTVANIDCTLICQNPQIAPHALNMTQNVANICGVARDCINIKATTTEGLGFIGRAEGIAAQASVCLKRI